jgi:hypothetical protein
MKFCYLDESGTDERPFAVLVGVLVDSKRMHCTKDDWNNLMDTLSKLTDKTIKEFHTGEFYRGNGPWRGIDGNLRADIITAIIRWFNERKHKISFCGIDKNKYKEECERNEKLKQLKTYWCTMALHQILSIQKRNKNKKKNKGNTVFIFDKKVMEKTDFLELIENPPEWIHKYYQEKKDKDSYLDQLIDVPYFGDSEYVKMIQLADFFAYFIRMYVELKEGYYEEKYEEETGNIKKWVNMIMKSSIKRSKIYLHKGRDVCSELLYKIAPKSLTELE